MCAPERVQIAANSNLGRPHRLIGPTLSQVRPDLAAEWIRERTPDLTPDMVSCGSRKKAWWRCATCNHEWEAYVMNRAGRPQSGCPACSKVAVGHAVPAAGKQLDLANPAVAALWHPTLNGALTPDQVGVGSARKVWWLLPCGHHKLHEVRQKVTHPATVCDQCVVEEAA